MELDVYEQPLIKRENVVAFLNNYNYLKARLYYSSDFTALIQLIDFDKALMNSGLTAMEINIINLVFLQDMQQVKVAENYGVTRQTINTHISRATEKIAEHYRIGVVNDV